MPVILILQVSTVTVAHDLYGKGIGSFLHIVGNIKFCIQFTVLGIPHLLSVYPEIEAGFYASKVDQQLSSHIICRNVKGAEITARQVFARHVRSIQFIRSFCNFQFKFFCSVVFPFERIQHIGVNRFSISLQFPVRWHWDFVPGSVVKSILIERFHLLRASIHFNFPVTVQICNKSRCHPVSAKCLLHRFICTVGRMHGIAVFLCYVLIFPVSCLFHG